MAKIITASTLAAVEKTFTFVGVSDLNGIYKARFANAADRVKVLKRNGHEDIRLFPLPHAMTKLEAVLAIKDMEGFEDIEAQQAFADFLSKYPVAVPQAVATEVFDDVDYAAAADALEAELATA